MSGPPSEPVASATPEPRGAWPHLRAALILGHVLTLVMLSLPGGYVVDKRRWSTPDNQSDLAGWAEKARRLGFHVTNAELEARLFAVATAYASVMGPASAPFRQYAHWTGTHQGWVMFSSPQRHPREIHVDVIDGKGLATPLHRPRSDATPWRRAELDHDRFRKLSSRFGKGVADGAFDDVARWLAKRAFEDVPSAVRIRVSLVRYDLLPPERLRAGEVPVGVTDRMVELSRKDLP